MMTKKDFSPALSAPCGNKSCDVTPAEVLKAFGRVVARRLASLAVIKSLARLYSDLLEEEVSPRRTLRLLHAQLAMLCLLLPYDMSLSLRWIALVWAAVAVCQVKNKE